MEKVKKAGDQYMGKGGGQAKKTGSGGSGVTFLLTLPFIFSYIRINGQTLIMIRLHTGHLLFLLGSLSNIVIILVIYKGLFDPILKVILKSDENLKNVKVVLYVFFSAGSIAGLIIVSLAWNEIDHHGMIFFNIGF